MQQLMIETCGLTVSYPDGTVALEGVTMSVATGEVFGLLGRNGAGKSTAVRALAGLLPFSDGAATLDRIPLDGGIAAVRRSVGVALQSAALDGLMTVEEHLRLVSRLWGLRPRERAERIDWLLTAFGLADTRGRQIGTLSLGAQRRVDLATALIHRPPVLFLDEPTTGLDPQSRRALWSLLGTLRDSGTTMLLTTQYLEEADALCDRVGVLDRGRLCEVATPETLKRRLGDTVLRVRVAPHDLSAAAAHCVSFAPIAEEDGWLRLHVPEVAALQQVLGRLDAGGVTVLGLTVRESTLEDVFIALTGAGYECEPVARPAGIEATRHFARARGGRR